MKKTNPLLLLIFLPVFVHAQDEYTLAGIIADSATGKPVQYGHVINFNSGGMTFSDSNGYFKLKVTSGDTLILSSIGFLYMRYVVTGLPSSVDTIHFEMQEAVYDIEEAKIHIPGSYDKFKYDFLALDPAETPADKLRNYLMAISPDIGREAYEAALARGKIEPPAPGFKILTSDEKARIRLQRSLEKRERQNVIYEKYNASIIKAVTGMTDVNEILSFMFFCNFSEDYLLEVNPLDLLARIAEKYKEYLEKKEAE